jgi:soluble lytic murein transglycosylase-like protein
VYLEKKSNNRSKCRLRLSVIIVLFIICSTNVLAGNQKEEDLKEETKNLMSKSISDIAPKLNSFKDIKEEYHWMVIISGELSKAIPEKIDREDFIKNVHYEATRAGLDPLLVLGLIKVESAFQKYAISSVGARGYMQVMPFWINVIGQKEHNLFHMRTNLRYGCTILKHYLDRENGNMFLALGRYNGSRGKDTYPNAVLKGMTEFKGKIK